MRSLRVSFLCSLPKVLSPIADYLLKKGISVTVFTDPKLAVAEWTATKPDYVFLSWNLKTSNSKKLAETIKNTLGIKCIGFAEESDPKTAASLVNSPLDEILHAPISGPVTFLKLQKIEKLQRSKAPMAELPKATNDSEVVWGPASYEKKDLKKAQTAQLERLVNSAFTKKNADEKQFPIATTDCVVMEVSDPDLVGYIVVASNKGERRSAELTGAFKARVQDALLMFGRGLQITGSYTLKIKIKDFNIWGQSVGRFYCTGKIGTESLAAFFIESILPKPKFEVVKQFVKFPIESFIADEELSFDVYIHLPVNDRFLKFYKKNSWAEELRLKKLRMQGVDSLLVKKEDQKALDQYLVNTQVKRTANGFLTL